jgi:hypothetical protein
MLGEHGRLAAVKNPLQFLSGYKKWTVMKPRLRIKYFTYLVVGIALFSCVACSISHPDKALKAATDQEAGFVVAGSTMSFVAGVDPQFQSDILNSTLLAQLAANKKQDRETEARQWYNFYTYVLENIGWVVQQFEFTKFNAGGGSFTCDQAVIDILEAIADGPTSAVVSATLQSMKNLSGKDDRLVLFERESHSLHQGNFQISAAQQDGMAVSMLTAGFEFKSAQDITRLLWFSWETSSSELYHGAQTMTLNLDVYKKIRDDVVGKLGDKATKFIQDIEI